MSATGVARWLQARWLARAAAVYVVLVLIVALASPRLLGHDEAAYAVGARGLWSANSADEFPLHRSIGTRLLAAPSAAFVGAEAAMRIPFALIALGYLTSIFLITRRWFGVEAAALALAVQATTWHWQWRASELLSDIPSALALLGMAALCTDPTSERSRLRALATAILAAAACYVRYASAPVVGMILVVTWIDFPSQRRWLITTATAALALMAPFLAWSVIRTGSVFGVLAAGERLGGRGFLGDGLLTYLRTWPTTLAGPVTGAVAALGLVIGLRAWRTGSRATPTDRTCRSLATVALGQILLLGWRVHGECRFIFFALTVLIIIGTGWLAQRPRWRRAVWVAVALTAIPSAIASLAQVHRLASWREPFADAAAAIRADAAGRRCLVFTTEVPMTIWYTGCEAIQIVGDRGIDATRATGHRHVYLFEASGLPHSIGQAEATSRPALGWKAIACSSPTRMCVWRATTPTGQATE